MISIVKSIHGQRYKIIQINYIAGILDYMAGLADSKNPELYTVHAMQLYTVQGLTPPIHACAVRFMNFGAETKFEKGASDRNSHTVERRNFENCST